MVRYRRTYIAGGTYFFTLTLKNRRSRALVEHIANLRHAFRATRAERPFTLDAIVVLPEHLHAVMTLPEGDADYSGRWRRIKALFTRRVSVPGCGPLWQSRFWEHTVRDSVDLERHIDYIHFNPVKHGVVPRARDWPFSSFHRYVREGWLPADWGSGVNIYDGDYGEPPTRITPSAPSGLRGTTTQR